VNTLTYANAPRANPAWGLAIFASRESVNVLSQTLQAARQAAPAGTQIDVLVNGNPALAQGLAHTLSATQSLRVWSIPLADKANAWNQYIHQIWAGEDIAFFIDGYVRLNPDAVELLGGAVQENALALGGTGVPTMGRSAKALRENMIINTGFHGNFCCIKGSTIGRMRDQKIQLPVGLYRTDSLMGAILSYALDPSRHVWEDHRIHVHPQASWQINPARWWRLKDLQGYAMRHLRQARGTLEKAAFADHLVNQRLSPTALPDTAREMVLEWISRCPADFQHLARSDWLVPRALRWFQNAPALASDPAPQLVWPYAPQTTA